MDVFLEVDARADEYVAYWTSKLNRSLFEDPARWTVRSGRCMLRAGEHLLNFIWFEGVVGPNGWSRHNHFLNVLFFVVLVSSNVSEIIVLWINNDLNCDGVSATCSSNHLLFETATVR